MYVPVCQGNSGIAFTKPVPRVGPINKLIPKVTCVTKLGVNHAFPTGVLSCFRNI